jgi:hypothetical protein
LILLRAVAAVTLAVGMAGRWANLAGLHDAARQARPVSEHQCDREQDQNFARDSLHLISA